MIEINEKAPASAGTPTGAGVSPYTNYITIPLEEYKILLERSTELDILYGLVPDGGSAVRILASAEPADTVPLKTYQKLQNNLTAKISELEMQLEELKAKPAHICAKCGRQFFEEPAISRHWPGMNICSVCATTEALEDAQAAGAISKGEANEILEIVEEVAKETEPEEMMEDVPAGEEGEEVVPRVSTPEQCKRGGKKNKPGTKANLPMEEICELKKQGWSNVRIAKKYDVTDVTIGSRIKSYLAEKKATVEMIRKLREEGWTYEKIEDVHGIPEEKIREMLREAGRAKKEGSSEDK